MASGGTPKTFSVKIETGDATKKLEQLSEAVKITAKAFEDAKASGSKADKESAKKAFEDAKRALMAYQSDLRSTAVAAGQLGKLSFSELIKAQRDLEYSMKKLDRSSEEYKQKMTALQAVKTEIAGVRAQMNTLHDTTVRGTEALAQMHAEGKTLEELPLDKLKQLEKELTDEIGKATRGSQEFIAANSALKEVRSQIADIATEMAGVPEEALKGTHAMAQMAAGGKTLSEIPLADLKQLEKELTEEIAHAARGSEEFVQANAALSEVRSQIAEVATEMAGVPQETLKGTQAIAQMIEKGEDLENLPLDTLKQLEKELTEEIGKATRGSEEFIEANAALKEVQGQIAAVSEEIKHFGEGNSLASQIVSGVQDFSGQLVQIPTSVGDAVAQGLGKIKDFMGDSVEAYKSFEDKSKNLSALTGLGGDDIAFLEQKARDLAATATDTAEEVLDAFTLMGSAKPELLKDKEALAETTEAALTLAAAAKMDAKSSVESLAATMNQFSAPASEANRYINALAAGSQAGSAAVEDISKSIVKFGATASAANLSVEESVGLIETLADKGIKGEVAGTALNGALLKLQTGVDQFNPKIVGMEQALDNLAAANLSTADMVGIFGQGNVVAGQILIENRKRFQELTDAVSGTSTAFEQAATNSDTLATKQKIAENTIQNVKIALGEKLTPIVAAFYEGVAAFWHKLEPMGEWLAPFFERVKVAFSSFLSLIGSVGKAIHRIYEIGEPVFSFLGKALSAIVLPLSKGVDLLRSFSQWIGNAGDVTRDYNRELAKEEAHLNMLASVAKRSAEGSQARTDAINALNKEYGKYLPALLTEKSSLEEIENAQRLANEALRYNIALKSQEERLSAIQKDATENEISVREKLNRLLKEQTGSLASQARKELEALLDDPEGDAKIEAFKEKWQIKDPRLFGDGLSDYVRQIREFRQTAETELSEVREAFAGMLEKKPQEYNHDTPTVGTSPVATPDMGTPVATPAVGGGGGRPSGSAAESWKAREIAELKRLRAEDVIDETAYKERLAEIEMTFLMQRHAMAVRAGEDTTALETQIAEQVQAINEERSKAEASARQQAYETQKAELENERAERVLSIQEHQLEDQMSAQEAAAALEEVNLQHLEALKELEEQYGNNTVALQEKILSAKLAIKKREHDELDKAAAVDRARAEQAEKERTERDKREVEAFKQKANVLNNLGAQLGQQLGQFATDAAFTEAEFGKKMAGLALDALHTVVRQSIASIWARSMASADSIATFGASGTIKAAALTAIVEGAFAVAKNYITASQHYAGTLGDSVTVRGQEDGQLYDAQYIGAPSGVTYVERPALIAERGGEIIVDAGRSRNIRMRYPWLMEQLRAVPQHAAGTLSEGGEEVHWERQETVTSSRNESDEELRGLVRDLTRMVEGMQNLLEEPLRAYLDREELFSTLDRRKEIGR